MNEADRVAVAGAINATFYNETISAERRDIWRLVDGAYKLASREIIVDQSTLGMSNFAIFL